MRFQFPLVNIYAYNDDLAHLMAAEFEAMAAARTLVGAEHPLPDERAAITLYNRIWAAAMEDGFDDPSSDLVEFLEFALPNSNSPWGYRRVDDGQALAIYEPEAAVVRLVHRWYTAHDYSLRDIRDALTEMAIPTHHDTYRTFKNAEWASWDMTAVGTMLSSPVYIGQWRKADPLLNQSIIVDVPPIMKAEAFSRAQRQRAANTNKPQHATRYEYLLAHRVTCGVCGSSIRLHAKRQERDLYLYYRCPTRKCETRGFRAEDTDAALWAWLETILKKSASAQRLARAEALAWQARREEREERIYVIDLFLTEFQQRLDRLQNWLLPDNILREARLEYERELQHAVVKLTEARDRAVTDLRCHVQAHAPLEIASAPFSLRRKVVELLDVHVTIAGRNRDKSMKVVSAVGTAHINL